MRRLAGVAVALATLAGGLAVANETLLSDCSRSLPAGGSLNQAYQDAPVDGCTITLAPGSYPAQVLAPKPSQTGKVIFEGAGASLAGFSTGRAGGSSRTEGAQSFELRNMSIAGQLSLVLAEDITLRNIDAGSLDIGGSTGVSVLGGDYGPTVDGISHIRGCAGTWGSCPSPRDILIDGAFFHDFTITNPDKHSECLMVWPTGSANIVIRNSTFRNCTDFNVLVKAPNTSGVVFERVTMDKPMPGNVSTFTCNPNCPRGGNSIRFSSYQYPGSRVADSCLEGGLGIDVAGFVDVVNTQVNAASCAAVPPPPPPPTEPPPTETEPPPMSTYADDFERAALGANWSIQSGTNAGIVAGSDIGIPSGSIGIVSWVPSVTADQFSEAEVAAGINPQMQRQVFVRRRASDKARYALHYNLGVSPQRWELKFDGVTATRLLATASAPSGPVAGDVIRIEAQGSQIRGYKNGQLVLSASDTAIPSGAPGMAFVLIGASVSQPEPVFERWAGGELVAAPPPPPADSLPLTILEQDATTVTVGWTPVPGLGYRFLVDGVVVSHTWDPNRASVKFAKKAGATLRVEALQLGPFGSVVSP